jgi:hypothetical protein
MESHEFTIEPVQNGWHALSRELNIAVWGATEEEASAGFRAAAEKAIELRERPEPSWGKTEDDQG